MFNPTLQVGKQASKQQVKTYNLNGRSENNGGKDQKGRPKIEPGRSTASDRFSRLVVNLRLHTSTVFLNFKNDAANCLSRSQLSFWFDTSSIDCGQDVVVVVPS
jgi:hypothetical protein